MREQVVHNSNMTDKTKPTNRKWRDADRPSCQGPIDWFKNVKGCTTNLHQPLQLVELAVKIFKVVLVESSQAIFIHDFYQNTKGLLLGHLKACG